MRRRREGRARGYKMMNTKSRLKVAAEEKDDMAKYEEKRGRERERWRCGEELREIGKRSKRRRIAQRKGEAKDEYEEEEEEEKVDERGIGKERWKLSVEVGKSVREEKKSEKEDQEDALEEEEETYEKDE